MNAISKSCAVCAYSTLRDDDASGRCVINPPVLSDALLAIYLARSPELAASELIEAATIWPAVWRNDFCGRFKIRGEDLVRRVTLPVLWID
ncbi:hypothetical protein [Methylomonas koyamae]|uniref:hypothetical protein n=1 Tax=Methylomonas koyamae TaxID=702114 RepID=UPI00112C449A|nr:hypothetical protein [Methylomonas koyamae]